MNRNTAAGGRYLPWRVRADAGATRNALLFAPLAALLGLLVGCSGGSSKSSGDGGDNSSSGGNTYAPTFTAVYQEVLLHNCALSFCHIGSLDNSLALGGSTTAADQAIAYKSLVNVQAAGGSCAGMGLRVDPGHPELSILVEKIDPPDAGLCGLPMPRANQLLPPEQIAQIKSWIMMGAKND